MRRDMGGAGSPATNELELTRRRHLQKVQGALSGKRPKNDNTPALTLQSFDLARA